ncbi:hypothetical protein D3C72_1425530 [compost metagenome]
MTVLDGKAAAIVDDVSHETGIGLVEGGAHQDFTRTLFAFHRLDGFRRILDEIAERLSQHAGIEHALQRDVAQFR